MSKLPLSLLPPPIPVEEGEPLFDTRYEDTQPRAMAAHEFRSHDDGTAECTRPGCCVQRVDLGKARTELWLWRLLASVLAFVLVLAGTVLHSTGCASAQGRAFGAGAGACALRQAPENIDATRAALSSSEWRAGVGGLALRLGVDVVRCLLEGFAASTAAGVSSAGYALRGCPSGSCDDVDGPEASEPPYVLQQRAKLWLLEHR